MESFKEEYRSNSFAIPDGYEFVATKESLDDYIKKTRYRPKTRSSYYTSKTKKYGKRKQSDVVIQEKWKPIFYHKSIHAKPYLQKIYDKHMK